MTMTVPAVRTSSKVELMEESRRWWVHLVGGLVWLVFGFAVLNGRQEIETVWTVAIFTGILLGAFALAELANAVLAEGWRWFHALMGVVSALAMAFAFAWPGQTFLTLAAIIGWYLLASGVLHIYLGFQTKGEDLWWARLVLGVGEVLLAFWAIGYPGRSIQLLILWLAATAVGRGLLEVMTAFSLHAEKQKFNL